LEIMAGRPDIQVDKLTNREVWPACQDRFQRTPGFRPED
jgi:hypothetical protein